MDKAQRKEALRKAGLAKKPDRALLMAASEGDLPRLRAALSAGADPDARDANGNFTALMESAHGGHAQCVVELLGAGADIDARALDGWTALLVAAREGQHQALATLLDAGAPLDARSGDGLSALDWAIRHPSERCALALMEAGIDLREDSAARARAEGLFSLAIHMEALLLSRAEKDALAAEAPVSPPKTSPRRV